MYVYMPLLNRGMEMGSPVPSTYKLLYFQTRLTRLGRPSEKYKIEIHTDPEIRGARDMTSYWVPFMPPLHHFPPGPPLFRVYRTVRSVRAALGIIV